MPSLPTTTIHCSSSKYTILHLISYLPCHKPCCEPQTSRDAFQSRHCHSSVPNRNPTPRKNPLRSSGIPAQIAATRISKESLRRECFREFQEVETRKPGGKRSGKLVREVYEKAEHFEVRRLVKIVYVVDS